MTAPDLAAWIGRSQTAEALARPEPPAALAALLDRDASPGAGQPLPPAWHWIYFLPTAPQHALGPDGHTETELGEELALRRRERCDERRQRRCIIG